MRSWAAVGLLAVLAGCTGPPVACAEGAVALTPGSDTGGTQLGLQIDRSGIR